MRRGYRLPKGCKDLIDVLKSKNQAHVQPKLAPPAPLPPITGEMTVPSMMTVRQLAAALNQKPSTIVADMLQMGFFASVSHLIPFDVISRVIRKYGFIAKKSV